MAEILNIESLPPLEELQRWDDWYENNGKHIIASKSTCSNLIMVRHRRALVSAGVVFPLTTGVFVKNTNREFEKELVRLIETKPRGSYGP
jgi:hypothetical protein